jgi:hypothetical protein
MKTLFSACATLSVGVLLVGCGDSDAVSPPPTSTCPTGLICEPDGLPFVRVVLPSTNSWNPRQEAPGPGETTAVVTHPESGKVCMSGRLEAGWGYITLAFAVFDETGLHDALDATALGIDRIDFLLESPPEFGLYVQLVSAVPGCTSSPVECQHWGFYLSDGDPGRLFVTTESGVVRARLTDFVKTQTAEASWEFDPAHLATLQIGAGAFGSLTGDYDFCISGLRFLDADGAEVSMPAR